jgi:hypothetical protein
MPSTTAPTINDTTDKLPTLTDTEAADYARKLGFDGMTRHAVVQAMHRGKLKYRLVRNRRHTSAFAVRTWLQGDMP